MIKFAKPIQSRPLLLYFVKFLGLFGLLFYGTEAVIAFSSPGDHYSSFVAEHLNFIDPFRQVLLRSSQWLLSAFGVETYLQDQFTLRQAGGGGIRMVYSCLGYGVLSFWIAFVFANRGSWKKKTLWIVGGCLLLCGINIIRISLLLIATSKGWPIPFGWDHHTWFNIVAYALIFCMMYGFDFSGRKKRDEARTKRVFEQKSLQVE